MSTRTLSRLSFPIADCASCRGLWAAEARPLAVWRPGPSYDSVVHPYCLEHLRGAGRRVPLTSSPEGMSVRNPYGPLLGQRVIEDPVAGLWLSDVILTVPGGSRGHAAMAGGGTAGTADDALTLGWIEALERRCSLRRPRERLILAAEPPGLRPR